MTVTTSTVHYFAADPVDDDLITSDRSALDRFVAAFVRICGLDHLDDAVATRHWLATDMRVTVEHLDRLLSLLRWQGLIALPNDHLVTVLDACAFRRISLDASECDTLRLTASPHSVGTKLYAAGQFTELQAVA